VVVSEPTGHRDVVVILTALSLEYNAVRAHLTCVRTQVHQAGTRFEVGKLRGTPWPIVLAMTGVGNTTAAVLVERAASLFAPKALLFVGVAGALADDIALGDVVVPTWVYAYHGGRDENSEFRVHPRAWEAPHRLEQLARHVYRSGSWTALLSNIAIEHPPTVHFRPIAAGDVVLNSRTSPLARQIRHHYNDAAAIEMEGAGVAQAGHLNPSLPVLTVRGISDAASGDKDATDRAGWQPTAAAHAAAFALALVSELASAAPESDATTGSPSRRLSPAIVRPVGPVQNPSTALANGHRGWQRFRSYRWAVAVCVAVLAVAFDLVLVWQLDRNQPEAAFTPGGVTTPFTPRRLADPSVQPATQAERTVQLVVDDPSRQTVHIDFWRAADDGSGDLRIDENHLYTVESAGLALLSGTVPASYARCAGLPSSSWTRKILLVDLAAGAQLCGYSTDDRYAMLQVISVPSARDRRLAFFGRTWQMGAPTSVAPASTGVARTPGTILFSGEAALDAEAHVDSKPAPPGTQWPVRICTFRPIRGRSTSTPWVPSTTRGSRRRPRPIFLVA
jgi:adenosylhomocysteine nucleosidase